MCLPASTSKIARAIALLLCLSLSSVGVIPVAHAETGLTQSEIDKRYFAILREEQERRSSAGITERLLSGLAALGIGLYGYYNDERDLLTKVVYGATQTAGTILVGGALFEHQRMNLLTLTDQYFARRHEITAEQWRRAVVAVERARALTDYEQLAFTSGSLALIYGYDGYRERGHNESLKNAFYFLGASSLLVCGGSAYRLIAYEVTGHDIEALGPTSKLRLAVLPLPQISWVF